MGDYAVIGFMGKYFTRGMDCVELMPVVLAGQRVLVPVAIFEGERPGKTLLVTGGMDGDEYAGIAAAYRLIDDFVDGDFAGRLIVVPIVNVPGFAAECSQNPMDQAFPKSRMLGRPNGMPTDRLVHWLVSSFALGADCWHDMHGGAITEGLQPFLWLYRTGYATDALNDAIHASRLAEIVVDERLRFGKAAALGKQRCAYMLAESGARGERCAADVERHLRWVRGVMHCMGMIDEPIAPVADMRVYRRVAYYTAPFTGIWDPHEARATVNKGDSVGVCRTMDGRGERTLRFRENGVRLWWKETMALRKGDLLCAVGHE